MWVVIVDDVVICYCASESDAVRISLGQSYGCDVRIEFID